MNTIYIDIRMGDEVLQTLRVAVFLDDDGYLRPVSKVIFERKGPPGIIDVDARAVTGRLLGRLDVDQIPTSPGQQVSLNLYMRILPDVPAPDVVSEHTKCGHL